VDAAVEFVRVHGGTVLHGPKEVPGEDRVAQCTDPQGAHFALHSTAR
jgi:predicted enzyme related to lactoylglutathione lyase